MKTLSAFILPILLGIAAGVLNFIALRGEVNEYVIAKNEIQVGDAFKESQFEKVTVRGKIHGAIPWADNAVLNGLFAPRQINKGEYIFRQDILRKSIEPISVKPDEVVITVSLDGVKFEEKLIRIGQRIGFAIREGEMQSAIKSKESSQTAVPPTYKSIGSWQVFALGSVTNDDGLLGESNSGRPSTLSIVVPKNLDSNVNLLLEANSQRRIAAVVLHQESVSKQATTSNAN